MTTKEVQKKKMVAKKRIFLVKENSKSLFEEKDKGTREGKTGPLKRFVTLSVKSSISIIGTKTLAEKSAHRGNRSNKNLNKSIKDER